LRRHCRRRNIGTANIRTRKRDTHRFNRAAPPWLASNMEERNEQQRQVEESADTRICSGSIGRLNSAAPQAKQPISQKKLAANRANAQRSTGPRTPAGKARAARNSLKHGFCAQHMLRELSGGAEDGAVLEILNAGIRKHYQPQGALAGCGKIEWSRRFFFRL
jgi:hypothetical protein